MNFCYKSKYDHCLKDQVLVKLFWVVNFLMEHVFTFKECQTNYGYSHLGIWQTFSFCLKWTSETVTSRKITHSMLLPVIKFKFSSINWNFRKHIPHFETVCFPYSQTFVIRVMVILTDVNLDSLIIKYVKFGRSVVTQWIFSKWSIHNATKSLQRGPCDYHNCTGHLKHKEIQVTKLMAKENNLINQEFKKGK